MRIPQLIRYPLAVVAGSFSGEAFSIPVAVTLDAAFGHEATGGRWPFTAANVILVCIKGLMTGYAAGWFSGKRGKLVGALAAFFTLFFYIAFSIVVNRDYTAYMDANYDTKPALWNWIALIPAIIGGHLGVKHGGRGMSYLATGLGMLGMYSAYIGCTALHVYTIVMAYRISGIFGAIMTFGTPPLAEFYWLVASWRGTGVFINLYSMYFLLLGGLFLLSGLLLGTGAFLQKKYAQVA